MKFSSLQLSGMHQPTEIVATQCVASEFSSKLANAGATSPWNERKFVPAKLREHQNRRKFLLAKQREGIWYAKFLPDKLRERIWRARFVLRD